MAEQRIDEIVAEALRDLEIKTVPVAINLLRAMSEEGRLKVFAEFCTHCGNTNPHCYCMRDD